MLIKAHEVINIEINNLIPYENNARLHSEEQIEKIINSIKEFGFINPVIIDENNMILVGHGRVTAAAKTGLKEVPCIKVENLTNDQKKAYILADNKLSDLSEWDYNLLNFELETIDLDMELFGFEIEDISDDFGTDFELPNEEVPQTRTITLSLSEEQYQIVIKCMDYITDNNLIVHDYNNANKKSNSLFEVVYQWAEQKNLL